MKNLIQKNIREIIPGSAVLVLRTYENKSGMVFSYRLRIRNQQQSKYQYLSLKATNERDAVLEAFEVYKDIADSLKKGAPVAADRKNLVHISRFSWITWRSGGKTDTALNTG